MTVNINCVNDERTPAYWLGLCETESTQFCPFSEDGHWHGVRCLDLEEGRCPYLKPELRD